MFLHTINSRPSYASLCDESLPVLSMGHFYRFKPSPVVIPADFGQKRFWATIPWRCTHVIDAEISPSGHCPFQFLLIVNHANFGDVGTLAVSLTPKVIEGPVELVPRSQPL